MLIVLIALAAVPALPNLPDKQANASLLIFVHDKFPSWVIGLLGGAGILVALVPTAVLVLTASSLFTRNVVGGMSKKLAGSLTISRAGVVVFTAIVVLLVAQSSSKLLSIMTNVYSAVGSWRPRCSCPCCGGGSQRSDWRPGRCAAG
ncbi:hypothetical protein [Amycolatopsis sp. NPDC051372]|uniref:hypothetical protein n=1 Tax=unclassified Amycolatopsis TaxID=2618356 RepID=UPI0034166EB3